MDKYQRTIPAGQFKQKCLALIDEVARTHTSLVITKRNKPVARLVPLVTDAEVEKQILTELRGEGAQLLVDLDTFLEPTETLAGWDES